MNVDEISGSILCGCGERTWEYEECWECFEQVCPDCSRIRWMYGYRVVLCPMCASELSRGDE